MEQKETGAEEVSENKICFIVLGIVLLLNLLTQFILLSPVVTVKEPVEKTQTVYLGNDTFMVLNRELQTIQIGKLTNNSRITWETYDILSSGECVSSE